MPHNFIRLLPFVFAGILCSIFFPVDSTSPGGWPYGVVDGVADFHGLLNHFITAFWNALHSIYAILPTTSNREGPHGAREPTDVVDYRAMLWAIARAQGWAGLDSVVQSALSDIGRMTTIQGGTVVRQEEVAYIRRLIALVLLELFSFSNPHAIFSPAVHENISNGFARSGNSSFTPILNDSDELASFIANTISHSASLATTLIRYIDEDEMIAEAFQNFASNPLPWSQYVQRGSNFLSIEEIVRNVHRSPGQPFRALPIIPNSRESSLFASVHASPDAPGLDLEAAAGPFALCDEDIEYMAALFIAAILIFHRRDGITA